MYGITETFSQMFGKKDAPKSEPAAIVHSWTITFTDGETHTVSGTEFEYDTFSLIVRREDGEAVYVTKMDVVRSLALDENA